MGKKKEENRFRFLDFENSKNKFNKSKLFIILGIVIGIIFLSQVFNVFVLPIVVFGIILIVNNKKVMKGYKTSIGVNIGLYSALFFSCVISYNGILALMEYFQ